jgi:hypothetical protein
MTELGASIVRAMGDASVSRLAVLSAALLFPHSGPLFTTVRWLLRNHVRDLRGMEDAVRASPLEWTIVRPPRLVHANDTRLRSAVGDVPEGGRAISFRAVAWSMLEAVEERAHVREIVGIAR